MKVTHDQSRALELTRLGLVAEPGEAIEVDDDVGKQLVAQGWTEVTATKSSTKKSAKSADDGTAEEG